MQYMPDLNQDKETLATAYKIYGSNDFADEILRVRNRDALALFTRLLVKRAYKINHQPTLDFLQETKIIY